MSTMKKIGGEYGEVRANIDDNSLNTYLAAHVPLVKAPVNIKQFKVLLLFLAHVRRAHIRVTSLDRLAFGCGSDERTTE